MSNKKESFEVLGLVYYLVPLVIFVGPGFWVKADKWIISFIYKYKTYTTYPLYETTQRFILKNK